MNTISGFSGFDPQAMMQKVQNNIKAADTDKNGAISFTEAQSSVNEKGGSSEMLNKMFSIGDANGDGELSQQEQDQMFAQMEEHMAKIKSMMPSTVPGGQGSFNSFQSLLDSLITEEESHANENDSHSNQNIHTYKQENQPPVDILA